MVDVKMDSLTHEAAMDLVSELKDMKVTHESAVSVYAGEHPERGAIYVIIPPFGNGYILSPLVIRAD